MKLCDMLGTCLPDETYLWDTQKTIHVFAESMGMTVDECLKFEDNSKEFWDMLRNATGATFRFTIAAPIIDDQISLIVDDMRSPIVEGTKVHNFLQFDGNVVMCTDSYLELHQQEHMELAIKSVIQTSKYSSSLRSIIEKLTAVGIQHSDVELGLFDSMWEIKHTKRDLIG